MKTDKLSWTTTTIAEIASVKTGPFGSALHESDYVLTGTPIVTVEHLSERGIQHVNLPLVGDEDVKRLSSYICRSGDILFSRVGSIDRNSLVSTKENGWLFSGRLLRVRTDSKRVHAPFLSYVFSTPDFKNLVKSVAVGQTMPSLNTKLLGGLSVSFPELEEQEKTAEILGDADNLISEFERLIAKKQAIKQGMMQQLLTGKIRLPGFTDDWGQEFLGELSTMRSGGTPDSKTAAFFGGGIPWVSISDMSSGGRYLRETEKTLSQKGLDVSAATLYDPGVILYAMYASIGECCIAIGRVASSQAILGITPSSRLNHEFLYYFLTYIKPQVREMGQQGTQSNLNAGMVRKFIIPIPTIAEQEQIVSVLSDVDEEIDALKNRLTSTRAIKQGMMQELLTGRTRLTPTGE